MYKIAYVDESVSDIRGFQRFAHDRFNVIGIEPLPSIDETIDEILNNHVDALVADFDLKEQNNEISYYGTDLVEKFLKVRRGFPIFIFTSHETDALQNGDDVNIIYEKGEKWIEDTNGVSHKNEKLLEKIKLQIEKYQHRLRQTETRLQELVNKANLDELTSIEEEELIKLDSTLELSLDGESIIPDIIKRRSESTRLIELLIKVDDLTKKLSLE